ncbi:hypothetical protein RRG08_028959 [Elysia crispata]|uniref:Uncharacterized protein n=1 Tax=Elysia crispata TaxID=231223 RepID=A0AAE1AR61_9GAST|nr:hypothetical protein RRG08_028959 [Elysia crispata]
MILVLEFYPTNITLMSPSLPPRNTGSAYVTGCPPLPLAVERFRGRTCTQCSSSPHYPQCGNTGAGIKLLWWRSFME